jgi:hypothetical protein
MNSATFHLAELARQIRGQTLQLLAATESHWLTWAPLGTSNHILWHAGHALWVIDALCIEEITGRGELPPGWAETFGADCRPVSQTRQWPPRDQVRDLLASQLTRFVELITDLPSQRLAQNEPMPGQSSLVANIIHGWHDEAKHQGEMFLLLKLCRAA